MFLEGCAMFLEITATVIESTLQRTTMNKVDCLTTATNETGDSQGVVNVLDQLSINSGRKTTEKIPEEKTVITTTSVEVRTSDCKTTSEATQIPVETFEELGLSQETLKGVYAMGFTAPSKIQAAALPIILQTPVHHLVAQSQAGTGKTAAFVLGMLARVDQSVRMPQALCMTSTREIALQIADDLEKMGQYTSVTSKLLVKDCRMPKKLQKIQDQIIIATPGKMLDAIKRKAVDFSRIKMLVLDEADYMIDSLGPQTLRINKMLPSNTQVLLFSATFTAPGLKLANKLLTGPVVEIRLKPEEVTLDPILQFWIDCKNEAGKDRVLCDLYASISIGQSIIFVNTRKGGKRIKDMMTKEGYTLSLLHGQLSTKERDSVMQDFRSGKSRVLVATNVLSRGVDVLQISLVINYDLPVLMQHGSKTSGNEVDYESYVHRIGRTGRWMRPGIAVNLVHNSSTRKMIGDLQHHAKKDNMISELHRSDIPSLEEKLEEMEVYE